jgi:hypothetical protein
VSASFKTSFGETLLDGVTGAKVQITATDVHGNTKSIVGLERANFYGSLAGKLDSQTIFTSAIAFQLGELSGFATSLGTVATSVVTLIQRIAEDPLFVVETIRQLIEVVRNLSAEVWIGLSSRRSHSSSRNRTGTTPTSRRSSCTVSTSPGGTSGMRRAS